MKIIYWCLKASQIPYLLPPVEMSSRKDYTTPRRTGPSVSFQHSVPEANPGSGNLKLLDIADNALCVRVTVDLPCPCALPTSVHPWPLLGEDCWDTWIFALSLAAHTRSVPGKTSPLLFRLTKIKLQHYGYTFTSSLYSLPFSAKFVSSTVPSCWPSRGESAQKFLFKCGSFLPLNASQFPL